jgi:hypothetical protein
MSCQGTNELRTTVSRCCARDMNACICG